MTYHYHRQEDTRAHLLEQYIRERLKDSIADEEDRKGRVVLTIGHLKILLQTVDFRIADVSSVEES